jgi:hypothetical protein
LASVLSSIFGNAGGSNAATGSGNAAAGSGNAAAGSSNAAAGGSNAAAGGNNAAIQQVSAALTSAFAAKPASGSDGALGSAQAQNTKLVVYGCGRQDAQVACVTTLANQDQKETLVKAGDVWKDAFIVDDRGDRHVRTSGFFLNVDGDQRPQLDISYGKSARFVLMFDGVQAKVQKVALRSPAGGLDIEEINLVGANAGAPSGQQH